MTSVYVPVRVEDPSTGHQFTTSNVHAATAGLTVLDKDVSDNTGRSIPARPRTNKAGRPAPRKSAKKATTKKES